MEEKAYELRLEIARAGDKMSQIVREILFLDEDKEKENKLVIEHNKLEILRDELIKELHKIEK